MSTIESSILVRPIWKIDLNHTATIVTSTPEAKRIAIASEASIISVAEFGQSSVQTINLSEPTRDLSINSAGNNLAVVGASRKLQVLGFESSNFKREVARWETPVYDTCTFSRDGDLLWTVGGLSDHVAEIHCYDARNWKLLDQLQFEPHIDGCGFILTLHPQDDLVGLWACGGPDELWNYWLRMTSNGIEFQQQSELDGCTPPTFNTRGDRFAAVNGYDLVTFSFPDCAPLYPPMTQDDEDTMVESLYYLDSTAEDRVLGSTNEGRVFILALEQGEVIAEVKLEGYEPKPCYQIYTGLSKSDDNLCSDLHTFTPIGNNLILSVHTNGKVSNRKDTILLWRAPDNA